MPVAILSKSNKAVAILHVPHVSTTHQMIDLSAKPPAVECSLTFTPVLPYLPPVRISEDFGVVDLRRPQILTFASTLLRSTSTRPLMELIIIEIAVSRGSPPRVLATQVFGTVQERVTCAGYLAPAGRRLITSVHLTISAHFCIPHSPAAAVPYNQGFHATQQSVSGKPRLNLRRYSDTPIKEVKVAIALCLQGSVDLESRHIFMLNTHVLSATQQLRFEIERGL